MVRIVFVLMVFFTACVLRLDATPPPVEALRLNVVFIFVDDQGYYDLGCYGATEVDTPRIDAFFYHGSQGALAAVRWDRWKLHLNPVLTLHDLETDPGETKPARNAEITRKLRGMAVMFQEEMSRSARPAGRVDPPVHLKQTSP